MSRTFKSLTILAGLWLVLELAVVSAAQLETYFDLTDESSGLSEKAPASLNNGLIPISEGDFSKFADDTLPLSITSTYWNGLDFGWERSENLEKIQADHLNFYSRSSVRWMVGGLGVGAILAHTDLDDRFRRWQHGDSLSGSSNDWSGFAKQFGEGKYILPAVVSCYVVGNLASRQFDLIYLDRIGEWGERGVRGAIVGLPALAVGQMLVGASRPEENRGSRWRPFEDNNGISGHSFMGALPFLTAANMTENRLAKTGLIFCSTLPAWSRLQDDAHYLSQALMGWGLAYMVCRSVDQTNRKTDQWQLHPTLVEHGGGEDLGMGISLDY